MLTCPENQWPADYFWTRTDFASQLTAQALIVSGLAPSSIDPQAIEAEELSSFLRAVVPAGAC